MSDLTLRVEQKWFEQIKAGTKMFEYRLYNDYWIPRIEGKTFDRVVIIWGYPSKDKQDRYLYFPWRGYEITQVTSEQWDNVEETVFAIRLSQ